MSVSGRIIRLSEFTVFCARCDESNSWVPRSRRAYAEFVQAIRKDGWRKRKAGWTCPPCCKEEAKPS